MQVEMQDWEVADGLVAASDARSQKRRMRGVPRGDGLPRVRPAYMSVAWLDVRPYWNTECKSHAGI